MGFFSEVDYHALLAKAGLVGYIKIGGTRQLRILPSEWSDFFVDNNHGLSIKNAEYAFKRFDLNAVLVGLK